MTTIKIIDEHQSTDDSNPDTLEVLSKPKHDYLVKYVVMGDKGVGKSSLVLKYTDNIFSEEQNLPFDIDFKIKFTAIGGYKLKEQFWLNPYKPQRIMTLHGIILTFDLTDKASFEHLTDYMKVIAKGREFGIDPVIVLAGTKSDLISDRKIAQIDIDRFMEQNNIVAYVETSSKTGNNIQALFKTASLLAYDKFINLDKTDNKIMYDATKNRYYSSAQDKLKDVLKNILTALIEHPKYITNFGGVNLNNKLYSQSAANIVRKIEEAFKHPLSEEQMQTLIASIRSELSLKITPSRSFLGIFGGRDQTTVDLYKAILKICEPESSSNISSQQIT